MLHGIFHGYLPEICAYSKIYRLFQEFAFISITLPFRFRNMICYLKGTWITYQYLYLIIYRVIHLKNFSTFLYNTIKSRFFKHAVPRLHKKCFLTKVVPRILLNRQPDSQLHSHPNTAAMRIRALFLPKYKGII